MKAGDEWQAEYEPVEEEEPVRLQEHRGGYILTLGILGIVLCQVIGVSAWVLANRDLKLMRAGRMDRDGEAMTKAGKICGQFAVAVLVFWVGYIVLLLGVVEPES